MKKVVFFISIIIQLIILPDILICSIDTNSKNNEIYCFRFYDDNKKIDLLLFHPLSNTIYKSSITFLATFNLKEKYIEFNGIAKRDPKIKNKYFVKNKFSFEININIDSNIILVFDKKFISYLKKNGIKKIDQLELENPMLLKFDGISLSAQSIPNNQILQYESKSDSLLYTMEIIKRKKKLSYKIQIVDLRTGNIEKYKGIAKLQEGDLEGMEDQETGYELDVYKFNNDRKNINTEIYIDMDTITKATFSIWTKNKTINSPMLYFIKPK